jgi:hypothetical protein
MWMILLGLAAIFLAATNAPACGKKHHSYGSQESSFSAMDTNHDGILTQAEFVAAHSKMGADKAAKLYKNLATLGGTTTKNGATGMTSQQFTAAQKAMKAAHSKKSGTTSP